MTSERADGPVDLASLSAFLLRRAAEIPREYVPGKTKIRDLVVEQLGASAELAEALVEQLEARGFVRYQGHTQRAGDQDEGFRVVVDPSTVDPR